MYLSLKEDNLIYKDFDRLRMEIGFSTFKSAIIASMALFTKINSSNIDENKIVETEER